MTIGGTNTLTIAGNAGTGITVNSGAGLFTLNANLTLAGASNTITVSNAAGAVINGAVGGSNGLIKAGTGTLTLGGTNNYTGATTVNAGTLNITGTSTGGGAFAINGSGTVLTISSSGTVAASGVTFAGTGSETLNLNGGTFLVGAGGISTPAVPSGGLVFNGGTLKSSAAFTISSDLPIAILSNSTIDTSGGNISSHSGFGNSASPGNLTIQGGNTLTGAFDSTMTGEIFVTGNTTLAMASASTATGILSIASGSKLDLNNSSASFGGLTGAGSVVNSTGSGVSTFTLTGPGGNNFSGVISAANPADTAVAINLTSGIQTFSGANTYGGGTTIQNGTLQLGINGALPTGTTVTINQANGHGNALLDLNGHSQTIAGLTIIAPDNLPPLGGSTVDLNGGVLTLAGNVSVVNNTTVAGNGDPSTIQDTAGGGALDLGGATRTFTIAGQDNNTGDLRINAVIQGTGGVVINASPSTFDSTEGGVVFGAANTYTGSTTVAQGRLTTTAANALPSTTDLVLGTANSALTGDVNLNGNNQTVNSLSLAGGNTGGTGNFITGAATLTVSSTTTNSTFGGLLTGSLSLVKDGTGTTLTLTTANNYTGSTTVNSGTLQVGITNALPTGTTVTLNNAAGSGSPILDINGHNQTIAGLTLIATHSGTSTVDVNGGTLTLTGNVNVVDDTTAPGNGGGSAIQDNAGGGALDLGGAVRTFNIAGQNVFNEELTVSTTIQNGGVIINAVNSSTQFNSAGVNFTAANTYAGGTTISSGYLLANNSTGSATGTGPVTINSGGKLAGNGTVTGLVTLNSGGAIEAGFFGVGHNSQGTLHLGSVTWNGGGSVNLELGTNSDMLAMTGRLTKGTGSGFNINITDAGGIGSQSVYTLATFASTTFVAGDFTLALPAGFSAALLETSTELDLALAFSASGNIIENVGGPNTPVIANFTVTGQGMTGTAIENNTINSLTMDSGSSLTIFDTLTLTSGNVSLPGGTATITGGTLFGPNGLHFDVSGNLYIGSTLVGNAVKTGTGSLFLDGTLYGNMSVLQGLLGGNGSIFGNLFNAGIVSPGHSPGRLGMSGNFTQAPSGLLRIEIGGTDITQHDLLSVGGKAYLDGTLQLVQLNYFQLKRNQAVTFLTASGGVSGRFSMVESGFTSNTILQPTVVYGDTSVALEALQGSFAALPGLTPNQQSVGRALDSAANDRRANSLFDYLDYRALNKLPGDLDRIAPEELTSVYTLGVSLATVQSLNVQRRTDDIRSGSSGFNAANLALNGDNPSFSGGFGIGTGVAGPSGDDGKEVKETKSVVPAENRWGVFLSGTGEWVSVGNTENARGYDLENGGFTLGVDYKVTPNLAIGLAAGYTGTTADLTNNGRIWVNGGQIGLYGTFFQNEQAAPAPTMSKDASKEAPAPAPSVAKGLYADVAVFGGYNSYDTRRSALQGEARGSTDGGELNVLFGTGYDFKSGGLTFGPTATFNYTYIGTSDFTEHGSLAPLDVHGGKGESLRTALGFKASYDWKVGGIVIKPELRAAWQHEYGDAAYAMDSSFASGAGNSFLVNGPKLGRDSALLGAGFAIQLNERLSTYFYYDGELGRTNYQSTNVTGGVRFAF